jgi:hypothetical protein
MEAKLNSNANLKIKKTKPLIFSKVFLYQTKEKIILAYCEQKGDFVNFVEAEYIMDLENKTLKFNKIKGDNELFKLIIEIFRR